MAAYKVTKEIVEKAKDYLANFPKLNHIEIGALCGVSGSTISRIKNGDYDYMLDAGVNEGGQTVTTSIPYEEFKKLVVCESIVKEILQSCLLSENDENTLFISYKVVGSILNRHIPNEVEKRLTELQEEKTEYSK